MQIACPNCGYKHPIDPRHVTADGLVLACGECGRSIKIKRKAKACEEQKACEELDGQVDEQTKEQAEKQVGESNDAKKVLVIDDALFFRTLLREMLEDEGCETLLASNGREGISLLCQANFGVDLIVLDLQMPEMSGFEVLQEIKNDYRSEKIPVLVMTGVHTESEAVSMVRDLGAEGYINKENAADHFRFRIHQILFSEN